MWQGCKKNRIFQYSRVLNMPRIMNISGNIYMNIYIYIYWTFFKFAISFKTKTNFLKTEGRSPHFISNFMNKLKWRSYTVSRLPITFRLHFRYLQLWARYFPELPFLELFCNVITIPIIPIFFVPFNCEPYQMSTMEYIMKSHLAHLLRSDWTKE